MKIYKKKSFIFSSIIILLIFSLNTLAEFRKSDKKLRKEFKKVNKEVQIDYIEYLGKKIRYYSPNPIDKKLATILFIHGAPGTGANYFKYVKDPDLMENANLISFERLGYGYSDFANAETSIEEQAKSIYKIIEKHQLVNVILVGWSYGVPIAGKMAFLYPEIKHNVLVAGAVSPEDEKFFGISKLAQWKLTKWLVPKSMKVADEEKLDHVNELIKMENNWGRIESTITYYHGNKNGIVPFENMHFMKTKVSASKLKAVTITGKGHFILFNQFA